METILKIEEVSLDNPRGWSGMDGYQITTTKQVIQILISNGQSCCESWGYLSSEDNFEDFIGAEISGMKLTDTALNVQKYEQEFPYGLSDGEIQFVDLETSNGPLQFAVYNIHNGYYGHSIEIKGFGINLQDGL